MKHLKLLAVIVFLISCSTGKQVVIKNGEHFKKYETKNYTLYYPTDWTNFFTHGYQVFAPINASHQSYGYRNLINRVAVWEAKVDEKTNLKSFAQKFYLGALKYHDSTSIKSLKGTYGDEIEIKAVKHKTKGVPGGTRLLYKVFQKGDYLYTFNYSSVKSLYDKYLEPALKVMENLEFKKNDN